ncbi:MAG: quinone oxidoreductase family protein [Chloroflexia bacterium]
MKAIRVHEFGGPEVLHYEDVPAPEPGEGQARVKIEAAGVNFIDIYYRAGHYKSNPPVILGQEAAGVVDAIGPGVQEVKVGDRVAYAPEQGAYAEYAVVPAWRLVPVPSEVDLKVAAAAMLQGMTAHYLSHSTYPIKRGDTALVHAGAGGVGGLLVQLAKLRGARVIATVSNEEKAHEAWDAGADDVILYTEADFASETKRLTGGQGVEVVYDSVGKTTFWSSLDSLRRRGYMVLYGQSSGAVEPVDPQVLNAKGSLFLTRPTLGHYTADRAELLQRAGDLFQWIASGQLKVRIAATYPLAQAAEAQRFLESRQAKGKVLLIP